MVWLKIVGSFCVVAAGAYAGFSLSRRCIDRPQQIRQFCGYIAALKSYIHYSSLPLAEALIGAAAGLKGPVADFFIRTAGRLRDEAQTTPQQAIDATLAEMEGQLAIERGEKELLTLLGANLGAMNRDEQRQFLQMIQDQLAKLEREAAARRDQNVKMYRYLGVCGSLAVVILLL